TGGILRVKVFLGQRPPAWAGRPCHRAGSSPHFLVPVVVHSRRDLLKTFNAIRVMPNKRLFLAASVALLSCTLAIPFAHGADEDFGNVNPGMIPKPQAASDAGEDAIARIRVPA